MGSPCSSCRTLLRLRFLVERCQLPPYTEGEVLGILRQAAGALADLVEQHGLRRPLPPPPPPGPVPGVPEALNSGGSPPVSKSAPVVPPVEVAKEVAEKPKEKKKKDKKGSPKEESKPLPRRSAGVEETPEEQSRQADVIRAGRAAPLEREAAATAGRAAPLAREAAATAGRAAPLEREAAATEEKIQAEVDDFARSHPDTFGLGSISVRGSAATHFKRRDDQGARRPTEPDGPPPRRESPRRERQAGHRERSRSPKRKKSKGASHRQRGRDFWKKVWPRK